MAKVERAKLTVEAWERLTKGGVFLIEPDLPKRKRRTEKADRMFSKALEFPYYGQYGTLSVYGYEIRHKQRITLLTYCQCGQVVKATFEELRSYAVCSCPECWDHPDAIADRRRANDYIHAIQFPRLVAEQWLRQELNGGSASSSEVKRVERECAALRKRVYCADRDRMLEEKPPVTRKEFISNVQVLFRSRVEEKERKGVRYRSSRELKEAEEYISQFYTITQ